ncbi:hypothetical protein B0H10DRAFT_547671 [Mycena sp. CBHHK59/15]|nr:hypothetical protein B0H10DRAFT_547671 [Mycena sp. CBHHK59/15]
MSHSNVLLASNVDPRNVQFEHPPVSNHEMYWTRTLTGIGRRNFNELSQQCTSTLSFDRPARMDVEMSVFPSLPSPSPAFLQPGLRVDSSPWEDAAWPLWDCNGQWSSNFASHLNEVSSVHEAQIKMQPFDSYSHNESLFPFEVTDLKTPCSPYSFPSPLSLDRLLPCPSPNPISPGRLSPFSSIDSETRHSSPRGDTHPTPKQCSHCRTTTTPLWRRDPATHKPLCNACGLYVQQRNKMRPAALIAVDRESEEDSDALPGGHECSHCRTRRTSVWRRSKMSGERLCNACGVYVRLRGRDRPLSLWRNKIRPRCQHAKK